MARSGRGLRLAGIPLQIHPSWLLTTALIVVAIGAGAPAEGRLPGGVGFRPDAYLAGAAVAAALFCSVLLHEIAHALVARRRGLPVRRITMYFFGGTAEIDAEALRAPDEALVSVAGPLVSAALAALFGLLWWAARGAGGASALALQILALANAGLAVLTLLPGYPLDGGRIVRAGLWYLTDDLLAATRLAALYGQALGWACLAGAVLLLARDRPLWAGALAFCGWFLRAEARRGYRDLLWRDLSRRTPVIHAAFLLPPRIPAARPLDEAVDDVLEGMGQRGAGGPSLVVDAAGVPAGVLGLDQLRAVKRARWATTTAGDAMLPLPAIPALPPDTSLAAALATLSAGEYSYALIVGADDPAPVGVITPHRIVRYLLERRGVGRGL